VICWSSREPPRITPRAARSSRRSRPHRSDIRTHIPHSRTAVAITRQEAWDEQRRRPQDEIPARPRSCVEEISFHERRPQASQTSGVHSHACRLAPGAGSSPTRAPCARQRPKRAVHARERRLRGAALNHRHFEPSTRVSSGRRSNRARPIRIGGRLGLHRQCSTRRQRARDRMVRPRRRAAQRQLGRPTTTSSPRTSRRRAGGI